MTITDLTKATFRCNECEHSETLDTDESPWQCPECGSRDIQNEWPAETENND